MIIGSVDKTAETQDIFVLFFSVSFGIIALYFKVIPIFLYILTDYMR